MFLKPVVLPNLAEIYKDLGVYEHVCDLSSNTTNVMNATVNCPQRDLIFTYCYSNDFKKILSFILVRPEH